MPKRKPKKSAGVATARATLAKEGLILPPIPADLSGNFAERGPWNFATAAAPQDSPYMFEDYVQRVSSQAGNDFVALQHDGHGINSYGLHYVLVWGPLRLFLQLGYGGVYMNVEATKIHINKCFKLAHELVDAVTTAREAGRLSTSDPLVIAASDFRSWHRFDHGESIDINVGRTYDLPPILLQQALNWVKAQG